MNEARFRSLVHEALGERAAPAWLNDAVRTRVTRPAEPSSRAPLVALVGAFLILAVLAVAIAPRLLNRGPAVTPGAVATPTTADWSHCTLPVIVFNTAVGRAEPGFVTIRTGVFSPAAAQSISTAGLPSEQTNNGAPSATEARVEERPDPSTYSSATRRWLPVPPNSVSPDGLSYVYRYQKWVPQSTGGPMTLMRYDIETGRSTALWRSDSEFYVLKWIPLGILVKGLEGPTFLVNPVTGAATQFQWPIGRIPDLPSPIPTARFPNGFYSYEFVGFTADGAQIYGYSTGHVNDPAATVWIFYFDFSGRLVYIYKGLQGGAPARNPSTVFGDGTGLWMSTVQSSSVWHWDATRGLHEVTLQYQSGANLDLLSIAGPCA